MWHTTQNMEQNLNSQDTPHTSWEGYEVFIASILEKTGRFIKRLHRLSLLFARLRCPHNFGPTLMTLRSPATRLLAQNIVQTFSKENIRAPHYWPSLSGGFSSQRASNVKNISLSWRHHAMKWNDVSGRHPKDMEQIYRVFKTKSRRVMASP